MHIYCYWVKNWVIRVICLCLTGGWWGPASYLGCWTHDIRTTWCHLASLIGLHRIYFIRSRYLYISAFFFPLINTTSFLFSFPFFKKFYYHIYVDSSIYFRLFWKIVYTGLSWCECYLNFGSNWPTTFAWIRAHFLILHIIFQSSIKLKYFFRRKTWNNMNICKRRSRLHKKKYYRIHGSSIQL